MEPKRVFAIQSLVATLILNGLLIAAIEDRADRSQPPTVTRTVKRERKAESYP